MSVSQLPNCTTVLYRLPDQRPIDRADAAASGGRLGVEVLVDLPFSCPWSARSETSWISVESPAFPSIARGDGGVVERRPVVTLGFDEPAADTLLRSHRVLQLARLKPGRYVIEVKLSPPSGKTVARRREFIVVRPKR